MRSKEDIVPPFFMEVTTMIFHVQVNGIYKIIVAVNGIHAKVKAERAYPGATIGKVVSNDKYLSGER
jgi:hypothetical protein